MNGPVLLENVTSNENNLNLIYKRKHSVYSLTNPSPVIMIYTNEQFYIYSALADASEESIKRVITKDFFVHLYPYQDVVRRNSSLSFAFVIASARDSLLLFTMEVTLSIHLVLGCPEIWSPSQDCCKLRGQVDLLACIVNDQTI